jgi:hypothetical protein
MRDPFDGLRERFEADQEPRNQLKKAICRIAASNKESPMSQEAPIAAAPSPKTQAQEVLDQLKKGKTLHDNFAIQFEDEYYITGKLMREWRDEFRLDVPPDLNPKICQDLAVKLMELHQEASFLKAVSEARHHACQSASGIKYRQEFTQLVSGYRARKEKLPAKDTLAQLADEQVGDMKDAVAHADIELSFWKEILNYLGNCRKLLENATINLSVEMKSLNLQNQSNQR